MKRAYLMATGIRVSIQEVTAENADFKTFCKEVEARDTGLEGVLPSKACMERNTFICVQHSALSSAYA